MCSNREIIPLRNYSSLDVDLTRLGLWRALIYVDSMRHSDLPRRAVACEEIN